MSLPAKADKCLIDFGVKALKVILIIQNQSKCKTNAIKFQNWALKTMSQNLESVSQNTKIQNRAENHKPAKFPKPRP